MAELNTDWAIGEYRGKYELCEAQYGGAIADGELLKITGFNTAGQPIVEKATGTDRVSLVAIQKGAGVSGDIKAVLKCGYIKLATPTHGADGNLTNLKDGLGVAILTGLLVGDDATNPSNTFGYAWQNKPAAGDFGILVYFDAFG